VSAHGQAHLDPDEQRHINVSRAGVGLLVAGLVVLAAVYLLARGSEGGPRRFWLAYVHNYAFFLSLSLGALFFVLLQHVTRSGWSVVIRRTAEVIAANLLVLAGLFVPIAAVVMGGSGILYPWARPLSALQQDHATHAARPMHEPGARPEHAGVDFRLAADQGVNQGKIDARGTDEETTAVDVDSPAEAHAGDRAGGHEVSLILEKRAYLNSPAFVARWVVYFAIWAGAAYWFWRRSVRQDASGEVGLTLSMQTMSAPALLAFALTVTLASFDLLMSLDPIWFSTIFGVYFFSGCVVGFFALMIATLASLQRRGLLAASVNIEHYHDLGKLLFGFVFFWGYIAFSQYMLIWYGNIPEETGWFFRRGAATQAPNVWSYVILLILLGHFVVPFVVLLSRDVKRRIGLLTFWAVWMLVLHWIDLYWLVMPEFTTAYLPIGVPEIGCLLGIGLIFVAGLAWWASGRSLVPLRDPRLAESLAFRNL
jgi:hypothetical protein